MNWHYTPYVLPLLVGALVSLVIARYVWQRRPAPGAIPLACLMLGVALWSLGYALEVGSRSVALMQASLKIQYLGIAVIPLFWLVFALEYTENTTWLSRYRIVGLPLIPAITLVLVWTNEWHPWFLPLLGFHLEGTLAVMQWKTGFWFWIDLVYAYGLLGIGSVLLVRSLLGAPPMYVGQVISILLGALIPWVTNILYMLQIGPFPFLNLTPFGFILTGLAMSWGLFHYKLLDIVPVARERVFESLPEPILVLDTSQRVVDLNQAAQDIFFSGETVILGTPVQEVFSNWTDFSACFQQLSEQKCSELVWERQEIQRYFELQLTPLYNRRNRYIGNLLIFGDITPYKCSEQALRKSQTELTRANQFKDEFLATMSHELRTPLNSILGLSEGLLEHVYGSLTEKQERSLQTIERSGRHLLDLVNDILEISKIEAGKLTLIPGEVNVHDLCQTSIEMIRESALKKHLEIFIRIDERITTVHADKSRLLRILTHLLENAVKFTDEGKIGIEVSLNSHDRMVCFTVWDTGIGISPSDAQRLFQPFGQLDRRLARRYSGAGIGLFLVQRLAELHGGYVSLESELNQGSRFTISLPWRK